MATSSLKCTIVSHEWSNGDSWSAHSTTGQAYAGAYSDHYYAYCLEIKTPSFSGKSEKIDITLKYCRPNGFSHTSSSLRWALCKSKSNKNKYLNTYSTVDDSYQITSGTKNFSNVPALSSPTTTTLTINTDGLSPNTTYYLFMWASKAKSTATVLLIGDLNDLKTTVIYQAGVVYIDNGSGFERYQVYIDNGTSWDLYVPYIDNGSGWDDIG